jgi:signal transduction histidine kinase
VKIGARITTTTVSLVTVTLGLYSLFSLRARRVELERDVERQTALVGTAVQVACEAALQEGLFEDIGSLIRRWQAKEPGIGISYIDLAHAHAGKPPPGFSATGAVDEAEAEPVVAEVFVPPPPDPDRSERLRRLDIDGQPFGAYTTLDGRPNYTLTLPVRDKAKRLIGAIEMRRDAGDLEAAFARSLSTTLYAMGGLAIGLGLLVWLLARSAIAPLPRLLEAIDDVTAGDLGRVILGERDDEVGDLADRFNQMTASLREARAEILAGVDKKTSLEARLRHSEKLATIGQLAAGIAHEVGTPLNVIVGRARTMEKRARALVEPMLLTPSPDDVPGEPIDPIQVANEVGKNASIIATQTQRITRIIQQLLDFARRPAQERKRIDVGEVARAALDFLEHQLGQARVESQLAPFSHGDAPAVAQAAVVADPDQLQQVCLNLCLNSIQAMPTGGKLTLRTSAVIRRRPGLEASPPSPFVILEVADTGIGVPGEDRERIFEPFYSTKTDSGGTGLGLAVSNGIVKDHDGWIEIADATPRGTIFRVFLPAAET